ncbi:Rqc2 family fibronectin-binding protein [Caldisalinibacter kiritimatiensis]|uniref:Rqc2 homolog RqcH n=1 Tax=Caldisalinibacter kiritimatiensis TaxID=1304284 RepID=R1CG62_9FIRM|nr:NFACT RNA binding domain-containing protein [Caldisalinibacter kiritimatiensis]EOD01305.1 Fibronectin/fibrinogen-binding protein [Caldisalinibacter kiritimatiensis]
MSLDGIVVRAISYELKNKILNGKIDKVYQPEKDEVLLNIRNYGSNMKLLMSANNNNPRVHLVNSTKPNPQTPPMFCMLLRKHLQGGKIIGVKQISMERILIIEVENLDELGNIATKQLIIEIMGRHSNIIFVDKKSKTVIDAIKRIGNDISSVRQVLPGFNYELPPSQDKVNPLDATKNTFKEKLDSSNGGTPIYKFLYKTFLGLSPLIGREICNKADIDNSTVIDELDSESTNNLYNSFSSIMLDINSNKYTPNIVIDENYNKLTAFSAVPITQYSNLKNIYFDSISETLEFFYTVRDKKQRLNQKSTELKKMINLKLDRNQKKLGKQKQELHQAEKREKYKIYGDLLTANIYRITDKMECIEVENFYSSDMEKIKIKLDPRLSPSQNAQKYYKKYNKLKNAYEEVSKQIEKTTEEIEYLENVLVSIENCSDVDELEEIKEELINEGYLKKKKKNKSKKIIASKPRHFISTDGFDIYVGKNNKQNDYLTLKFADKEDIWLHTKDIPGSHVIIKSKGKEIPEQTIKEAALIAAFYSKGNMSSNVPVDYTERKNVRKPNGAKPGMVIYDNNSTIYVTPKSEEINTLKKVEE